MEDQALTSQSKRADGFGVEPGQLVQAGSRSGARVGKIAVCVTEDWFTLSHFKPLLSALTDICNELLVITRFSGRESEIESLGARAVNFDYQRGTMNPVREFSSAVRLARIFKAEQPDVVHLVAMKPIVLGSLATRFCSVPAVVVHMTGLGHLAISRSAKARLSRKIATGIIASRIARKASWLLVENPDDLEFLQANGVSPGQRVTILGGAGVDPIEFPAMPAPMNDVPVVASVGRMIRSKGLDVLVEAYDLLAQRGVGVEVKLYGKLGDDNPETLPASVVDAWTQRPGVSWYGHVDDVREIWRRVDVAVLPARSREGMPRALLEAAALARPLVVTDVPGCRHLVRHEVEGLVIPPEDPVALADALQRLIDEPELRLRLGEAARLRIVDGFTEQHLIEAVKGVYGNLEFEGGK